MLDEMTTFLDTSISDYVRQILFIHLYGRYDLLGLLEEQLPALQEGRGAIIAGPPDEFPGRSLNKADIKVWLPRVMKDDLTFLAKREGMTLSKYVRTIIATHLTGHPALLENSLVNRPLHPPIKKQPTK